MVRDLLFYKRVTRDSQDLPLRLSDKQTLSDIEGYQSCKENRVLTKINKP